LDFTPADYQDLQTKFVKAAQHMQGDGWWVSEQEQPGRERRMRSRLIWEMLGSLVRVPKPLHSFCAEVMRRKHDDHVASHSHVVNQFFHLLSSSVFIYCYVLMFSNLTMAVCFSLAALLVRQFGHAVIEPPCHDKEELLLGFNTRNKTLIVAGYGLIPIINMAGASSWTLAALADQIPAIAQQWFSLTMLVVLGRVLYLMRQYNFRMSMIWFVKLITDPFTDIVAYSPRYLNAYQILLPACLRKGGDQ
jgi:glutamate-1-semialdehyde 2,1-aminomutase